MQILQILICPTHPPPHPTKVTVILWGVFCGKCWKTRKHSNRMRTSHFSSSGGDLPNHPLDSDPVCRSTMQTLLGRPPRMRTPPVGRPPLDRHPLDTDPPVGRQTGVKTLPCSKLRLRTVNIGLPHPRRFTFPAPHKVLLHSPLVCVCNTFFRVHNGSSIWG